ncbi:hypothetical protein AtNW77_Chr1g0023981 [Arabidopsis thaliana]|uniref:At1g21390 n=4 Tax=Arabidopsis TaxID=3701 RepID=Q52K83_ARATH|nr:embryo defective 2170 [Arabidopsis thaliana]KAG7647095.1 hypothetical protein ISN45_At01g021650 [Arabidopsis thaliana x Arabidopsis arenosa]KAG7655072.1 hypothetical protein ISN44_As01g021760 [Arabidopsis suecica]AAY17422.1 At1g21390 [Arabidopsis thaliana]ABD60735.1 At1g21390 [Arabidopsis thaliana]AEE30097.1 embryo defective 2170 [Arabidopsis thaliana]|eukprot:NP_173561.2 embryo defective 2170 [Arabidopsis thaliana]
MLDPSSAKSFNTHLCFPSIPNDDHSDSGVCSPTLWRTSPPKSPPPFHRPEDYWSLSPDSKAQAIARGQRELMEMVSKMPESCYELSLKDLVEVKVNQENERKVFDELPKRANRQSKVVRKTKSDKRVDPNRSGGGNNSGFLLKIMFLVSLGAMKDTTKKKKKKKKDEACKVSPRPSISEETVKVEDKEWWNRMSESSTKRSGSSSSNNSIRSRSSLRDEKSSCFSFLTFKKLIPQYLKQRFIGLRSRA